ncbi:MAG: hypothetical protein ACP5FH_06040, partial [Terracidiphilus sp.]
MNAEIQSGGRSGARTMVEDPVVTHEDIDRARDRARVGQARRAGGMRSRLWLLWLLIGPGIL